MLEHFALLALCGSAKNVIRHVDTDCSASVRRTRAVGHFERERIVRLFISLVEV